MKRLLILWLAFIPSLSFAAGSDLFINQRNPENTATVTRMVTKPFGTSDGVFGFSGATQLPFFLSIGPGLSLSGGVLDAASSAPSWASITGKPAFSAVATSGAYADLSGKPVIPAAQVNSDWTASSGTAQILNKPALFSGAYSALTGIPSTFAPSAHNQAWSTITATPTTLSGYGITDAASLSALGGYATTAALTSGLAGKFNTPSGTTSQYLRGDGSVATFPAIPAAQVQSDWNANTGLGVILNKPTIPNQKRIETYAGTTSATGQIVVVYTTPFTSIPSVQPPPPSAANQVWTLVASTVNGFTLQLNQRNTVTLLSVEVLLGATVPVVGVTAQVLVVSQ